MCLPFQDNNPFDGIISLSLSGESANFKREVTSYLSKNEKTNIFIGYGIKYFGFNELAKQLKDEIVKDNLKVSAFSANHNEMPAISLVQGLTFLFKEYRNIDDFYTKSENEDFDVKAYLKHYKTTNKEDYGIETEMKADDFYSLIQMSVNSKNKNALNQLLEYDSEVNGYPTQTHMLFIYIKEIGDFEKADYYANEMLNRTDGFQNRVLKANLVSYYDCYVNNLRDAERAINFFKKGKENFKDNQLEFSYFIAKASIENSTKKILGKANLDYCVKKCRQNEYFKEVDLKNLNEK